MALLEETLVDVMSDEVGSGSVAQGVALAKAVAALRTAAAANPEDEFIVQSKDQQSPSGKKGKRLPQSVVTGNRVVFTTIENLPK